MANNLWIEFFNARPDLETAPVSSFPHVPLSLDFEANVAPGLIVEVIHRIESPGATNFFWFVKIVRNNGNFVTLRYLGAKDADYDFIRNIANYREPSPHQLDERLHPLGWSAERGFVCQRPPFLENSRFDQAELRFSLPRNFHHIARQENTCSFQEGDLFEVTDTERLSALRRATMVRDIGRRILARYAGDVERHVWFHELATEFYYPPGWGFVQGREVLPNVGDVFDDVQLEEDELIANFRPFLIPDFVAEALQNYQFEIGSKLEIIDPLEPRRISVGTIVRVLRNQYLVIQIDGEAAADGGDLIYVHAASPILLHAGFARENNLEEFFNAPTPDFSYENFAIVPKNLFRRHMTPHGFRPNQYLAVVGVSGTNRHMHRRGERARVLARTESCERASSSISACLTEVDSDCVAAEIATQNPSKQNPGMAGYVAVGVREYYAGKTLFVTGCTGFVGKVLLEKLLRSCPEVSAIYVLGRAKRGQTLERRFTDIFKSALFAKLQKDSAEAFSKVKFVNGDLLLDKMGLSEADLGELQDKVDIVVHSAASVRFDAPLRDAVNMNLKGTKTLLDIAKTFKHLEVFVHVSTCYANCDNDVIEERVYESKYDCDRIMSLVECLDDDAIATIEENLLENKPNTYTFTKHLTEQMLQKYEKSLPFSITIVRPSIVVASLSEPFPGWVDNLNGPGGLIYASACGYLRSIYSDREMRTDLIPVDVVVRTIIVAAWRAATSESRWIEVYNCAVGDRAPRFTWADFENYQAELGEKIVFREAIRTPSLTLRSNWSLHRASMFLDHYVPYFLFDTGLQILGKKPKLMKVYERLNNMQSALTFFTTHEWTFKTENLERLSRCLSPQDYEEFNVDVSSLDWDKFLLDYVRGLRDFVAKDEAQRQSPWLQRLSYAETPMKIFGFAMFFQALVVGASTVGNYFSLV